MKHLKSDRPKAPVSKAKIIVICVICALVAFGATLAVLLAMRGNLGYEEARNYADEILKTKDSVAVFLDTEFSDLEIDEEEQTRIDLFEKASNKAEQYMESLGASSAMKNKEVAEKYEQAKSDFEKIKDVAKVEKDVFGLLGEEGINEEKLKELADGDNEYLKKFAKDIIDYKKLAADFAEKYSDIKSVNEDAMVVDYGNFQIKGEEILEDYKDVSFKDIFGYSKDDVLKFYASIEELVSILNEKI
ncbi:hypothetical protein IKP94_01650 [Candidatus Saccharibacteria bacterium]|nr:hypothetical protein [Candidatus Saccharibacteria bacterium]